MRMNISLKARRVLGIILMAFLGIVLRVWHLAVIQREEKLMEAQKPQQRTILLRADRGTICDRFHIPMALNRICYHAAIYYNQIAQIPSVVWKGQTKVYARKEYIRELSATLAKTLHLDPERIEDLIHSKAALFPHVPFIIKEGLTEEEHYRLRMLEKDWPGIDAEISSTRFYPFGKTGCDVIGTIGSISQKEFLSIAQKIRDLQEIFDPSEEECVRLAELKEKAYAINDLVGKTGIEAQFEEDLRGFFGKKIFEVDQKGRFLREIGGKEAIPGKQIVLTLSSELQQFAETLLIQDEKTREGRSIGIDPVDKSRKPQKQPWIKGGAIVAIDPKTGEVLALASHPRFDPNDFVLSTQSLFKEGKTRQVNRWLENDRFIGAIWDGHEVLKRERGKSLIEESQPLSWEFYLEQVLPKEGPLRTFFHRLDDVAGAVQLQEDYEAMLYFNRSGLPVPIDVQRRLDAINLSPQDKLFAVDLCRMVVYAPALTNELLSKIGSMKLSTYRSLSQAYLRQEAEEREKLREQFHRNEFKAWRQLHQKEFLAEKRKQEKRQKTYARPYLDYLDQKEKELFEEFWKEKRFEGKEELARTFRLFAEMNRPLLGQYPGLRHRKGVQKEKDLAAAFYPKGGFGFSRSFAFQSGVPQGSIFKLVTAYEGLRQGKHLTLIDELTDQGVAFTLNRTPYPRFYKGGRLPRSAAAQIGKIDLIKAIEQTSNPYFSILAGDLFEHPEDLAQAAKLFGFGESTGIALPNEKRGNIPKDLSTHRTGLYSMAIGQHTLLTTPLQTAMMLGAIANGGKLLKPKMVQGSEKLEVRRTIPMPSEIRNPLIEGMTQVVWGSKGSARPQAIKALLRNPLLMRDYLALENQMIGKTSTAEIVCNLSANPSSLSQLYKYIWFGGIYFVDAHHEDPELVVAVFLRYGDAGKEAAPLAAQMIQKWKEIKKKHLRDNL